LVIKAPNRTINALSGADLAHFEGVLHSSRLFSKSAGYYADMDTVFLERLDAIQFGKHIFYKTM